MTRPKGTKGIKKRANLTGIHRDTLQVIARAEKVNDAIEDLMLRVYHLKEDYRELIAIEKEAVENTANMLATAEFTK